VRQPKPGEEAPGDGHRHDSERAQENHRQVDVEAGVDLDDIHEGDVSVEGNTVTIDLPEAEILSASLDEETTRVYDRDFSPLNLRPDDDLVEKVRLRAVEKITASARENGVLDTAESNAEDSIRAFVTTLGFEKVAFR